MFYVYIRRFDATDIVRNLNFLGTKQDRDQMRSWWWSSSWHHARRSETSWPGQLTLNSRRRAGRGGESKRSGRRESGGNQDCLGSPHVLFCGRGIADIFWWGAAPFGSARRGPGHAARVYAALAARLRSNRRPATMPAIPGLGGTIFWRPRSRELRALEVRWALAKEGRCTKK